MFDKFFSMFKSGSIHKLALVANIGSNIVKALEQEFAEDHNAKNAAIDTLIQFLLSHKVTAPIEKSPTQPPVTPVV